VNGLNDWWIKVKRVWKDKERPQSAIKQAKIRRNKLESNQRKD